jgi:glyoxylase-like metal-dependent hydrolase (beta-lactamase superfamily II)
VSRLAADSHQLAPSVFRVRDTCNVYVLRSGREAVLVDFGSGLVLDRLGELGVDRVTDVLLTHHHRDQVQGLARAVEHGARVWAPPLERGLVEDVDRHWLARPVEDDYDLRQDRFSLLEPVRVEGSVREYRTERRGGFDVYTLPTPGHTIGSVTYLVEVEGRRIAFSGDLVYGDGKVWSLAATQWTYGGVEGQAATILSLGQLAARSPDLVLPSHGEPIEDPEPAFALARRRLTELMELRREQAEPWDLDGWLTDPWETITPHLLRNRTSIATTYALLSDSGSALLFDFGYDLCTGWASFAQRSTRRPLVATPAALESFGVERVEAVVVTHYHDDHVAGLNLLRDVEGVEVWAPENVAPILEEPRRYDLPCLWFDPIPVDRVLAHGTPVRWHEYELTTYPLPGHTLYAAAIAFEVDGRRVLATGDQQTREADGRSLLNYQYRNRFQIDDYVRSAALYRALRPDLLITGHWGAHELDDARVEQLLTDGLRVAELHRELLPLEDVDFGAEGFGARIAPYRCAVAAGEPVELEVTVRNPFDRAETAVVALVVPAGWPAPDPQEAELAEHGEATLRFRVTAGRERTRRARVGVDLTVGGVPFGQQAEALVDVL